MPRIGREHFFETAIKPDITSCLVRRREKGDAGAKLSGAGW